MSSWKRPTSTGKPWNGPDAINIYRRNAERYVPTKGRGRIKDTIAQQCEGDQSKLLLMRAIYHMLKGTYSVCSTDIYEQTGTDYIHLRSALFTLSLFIPIWEETDSENTRTQWYGLLDQSKTISEFEQEENK